MNIALVWATNNKEKYGNKILHNLLSKWHLIFPVNNKEDFIETLKSYKNLWEIKNKIDIVNIVTPPKITLEILKDALELNLKKVWIQPWASDEEVINFLKGNDFDYIADSCIMIDFAKLKN